METFDAASYLTEKLRTLHPESFEEELERTKRNARRQGVIVGAVVSLFGLAAAVATMFYFAPELAATLLAGMK
jgi:hypothetical protein